MSKTNDQIKEELDAAGISYDDGMQKKDLLALLPDAKSEVKPDDAGTPSDQSDIDEQSDDKTDESNEDAKSEVKLNKDGLEPGKPVSYDDLRRIQAKNKAKK